MNPEVAMVVEGEGPDLTIDQCVALEEVGVLGALWAEPDVHTNMMMEVSSCYSGARGLAFSF